MFRSVGALLLGAFILMLGSGLLGTLIGVRAVLEGFSVPVTGVVMSAYFAGLIAGSLWCRAIVRRVGHIRTFSALASTISVVSLFHAFQVDPISWSVLRAAAGFCFAGLYIVMESWLNSRTTNASRGAILSIYMVVTYIAVAAGQFLLLLGPPRGVELFALVSVLFSLSVLPIALTKSEQPALPPVKRFNPLQLIETSPFGFASALAAGLLSGAFYGMGPVFAATAVEQSADVATFMGLVIFAGLVLQWPIGWLSDRLDRRQVIVAVTVTCALFAIAVAATIRVSDWLVIALAGASGGLGLTLYSLAIAYTNDHVDSDDLVEAAAGLLSVWGAGAMVAPLVGAVAMTQFGPGGLFLFIGVTCIALSGFGLYRMARREPLSVEDQTPFVAMPRTSTEAVQMYSEALEEAADDEAGDTESGKGLSA